MSEPYPHEHCVNCSKIMEDETKKLDCTCAFDDKGHGPFCGAICCDAWHEQTEARFEHMRDDWEEKKLDRET